MKKNFSGQRSFALFGLMALPLAALLSSSAALATAAYEAPPGTFTEGSFGFSLATEYFTSKANYESSRGSYTRLTNDDSFNFWETHLRARITPSTRFSIFAGSTFGSARAVTPVTSKTNSQISEAFGGIDWLVNTDYVQLTAELLGSYALDVSSPSQAVPMTNDGFSYARPGLFAQKALRRFRLGAYAGIQAPTGDLATRFLYEATFDMRLFWSLTIGGGIDGYETLMSDKSTLLNRQSTAALANVGSEKFYSYNPSLIEARGWIGFRPNRSLWFRAGYAKTINGLHTAEGQSILFSIVFNSSHIEMGRSEREESYRRYRPTPEETVRSFEPDVETTQQDIFEMDQREEKNSKNGNHLDQTEQMLEKKVREK